MEIAEKLVDSSGFKRRVASALSAITGILVLVSDYFTGVPVLSSLFSIGQASAGAMGTVGVVHALKAGTASSYKSGTIASVFAGLALIAQYVPALQPYSLVLQGIAAIFGAKAVVTNPNKNDE